jgi:hypothetical protein
VLLPQMRGACQIRGPLYERDPLEALFSRPRDVLPGRKSLIKQRRREGAGKIEARFDGLVLSSVFHFNSHTLSRRNLFSRSLSLFWAWVLAGHNRPSRRYVIVIASGKQELRQIPLAQEFGYARYSGHNLWSPRCHNALAKLPTINNLTFPVTPDRPFSAVGLTAP